MVKLLMPSESTRHWIKIKYKEKEYVRKRTCNYFQLTPQGIVLLKHFTCVGKEVQQKELQDLIRRWGRWFHCSLNLMTYLWKMEEVF